MENARYCGQCGTSVSAADDRFCRSCGKPLDLQSDGKPTTTPKKGGNSLGRMLNLAIVLVAGALTIGALGWMFENSGAASRLSATPVSARTINTAVPCAGSESDEAEVIRSVLHHDIATYVGLSAHKHIPQIEAETTVDVIYTDGDLTNVAVTSGLDAGMSCWVPTKAIE